MSIVLVILATGSWYWWRQARIQWAKNEAIPRIEQLLEEVHLGWNPQIRREAFRIAEQASTYISGDPDLERLLNRCSGTITVNSEPSDALVQIKPYDDQDSEWVLLGQTPLEEIRLPWSFYIWRIEKPGYQEVLGISNPGPDTISWKLDPDR